MTNGNFIIVDQDLLDQKPDAFLTLCGIQRVGRSMHGAEKGRQGFRGS